MGRREPQAGDGFLGLAHRIRRRRRWPLGGLAGACSITISATDHDLQRFLNVERLACQAFERSYTSYIEDLAIFGTTPAARTA